MKPPCDDEDDESIICLSSDSDDGDDNAEIVQKSRHELKTERLLRMRFSLDERKHQSGDVKKEGTAIIR